MQNHTKPISTTQGPLSVQVCSCGGVHLCLGGVSLNLSRDTVQYLKEQFEKILEPTTQKAEKNVLLSFPN